MYEFWYDYVKPKYDKKQNCAIWIEISLYTQQQIFTIILPKILKQDLTVSNYKLKRPLAKRKNEKVIGLMKGELGGK